MSTIKDFMNNLRNMANQAKTFSQTMPQGAYKDAHFEKDSDGSFNLYYKPTGEAKNAEMNTSYATSPSQPMRYDTGPRPVPEGTLNGFIKNFQKIMDNFNKSYSKSSKPKNAFLTGSFLDSLRESTGGNVSIEMDSDGRYNLYMSPEFYNKFHGSKKRK